MQPIHVLFYIKLPDFRKATYYGLFLRHRRALQIMFAVILGAAVYALAGYLGAGAINPLVLFIAGAYLIWGMLLFAGAERGISAYIKSEETMFGCEYSVALEESRIHIKVPERKIDVSYATSKLACVFELSDLFLIYVSAQDVYLLPKRALSEEQTAALRANFRTRLGERFSSRFEKKKK